MASQKKTTQCIVKLEGPEKYRELFSFPGEINTAENVLFSYLELVECENSLCLDPNYFSWYESKEI